MKGLTHSLHDTIFFVFLVQWKIKESMIVLGKPLNLECTTSSTNNRNVSRRWTGGAKNRLLCFNGVTINPQKYEETEESSNKYTLQIKETTEDDLDCSYSCRFGFQSDEKILYVTENNFNCKFFVQYTETFIGVLYMVTLHSFNM